MKLSRPVKILFAPLLAALGGCGGPLETPGGGGALQWRSAWTRAPFENAPLDVALSRDGAWVALLGPGGKVVLADAETGNTKWTFDGDADSQWHRVAFTDAGNLLLVLEGAEEPRLRVLRVGDGREARAALVPEACGDRVHLFRGDKGLIVVVRGQPENGGRFAWIVEGKAVTAIQPASSAGISPDGSTIAVARVRGHDTQGDVPLDVLSTAIGDPAKAFTVRSDYWDSFVRVSADASAALSLVETEAVAVTPLLSGGKPMTLGEGVMAAGWMDGDIITGHRDGSLRRWHEGQVIWGTMPVVREEDSGPPAFAASDMLVAGGVVALYEDIGEGGSDERLAAVCSVETGHFIDDTSNGAAFSVNGGQALVVACGDRILVYRSGRRLLEIPASLEPFRVKEPPVCVSERRLVVTNGGTVTMYELR